MPKIIQSGGLLDTLLRKCAGPLMKVAVSLAKNVFAPLFTIVTASLIDGAVKKKKKRKKGVVRAGKRNQFSHFK